MLPQTRTLLRMRNRSDMKFAGAVFLFFLCAVITRAQDIDAVLNMADSLAVNPEIAVEILNRALADNPDSEELLKVRAEAYENLKLYDKAIADYRKLTQLDPDEESFWYLLGRNQYHNGQFQDALKSLHRATRLNSQYLPAYHAKIQALLQLNQNDAALRVSDSTLNIGETATTYFLQGEVYSRLKLWQRAEWAYHSAVKIDRGHIDAYIALANVTATTNKARETLEAAESALGVNPGSIEALIVRSRGFALLKNYTEAIEDVTYVIELDPNNIDALYWRGIYYKDANRSMEAIRDFEQALKLQPDYWLAIVGRADVYAKMGNKDNALEGYQILLDIAEEHPEKETITQIAHRQIFELNREENPPILELTEPTHENFVISVPDDLPSIVIKGKITEESAIRSLIVNGQNTPVTRVGNDFEFAAVVNLENVQEVQIEVSDVYNNAVKVVYRLERLYEN